MTQKTEPGADRPPGCMESMGLAAPQDLAGPEKGVSPIRQPLVLSPRVTPEETQSQHPGRQPGRDAEQGGR